MMIHEKPVAIITGAGSGIGRAVAKRLSTRGPVVLVGRRADPLKETGSMLGTEGEDWIAVPADIDAAEDRERIIERTIDTFGRLDYLINNAGLGTCAPLGELSERQIADLISVNLTAPILLTRLALPHLLDRGGCVVSIGSRSAEDPFPGLGVYGCAKAGLEGLARCIANEYGDQGIRAYTIHPGAVETAMLRSIVDEETLPGDMVLGPDDIAAQVERFVLGQHDEPSGSAVVVAKN
ncbi:MAG: SDR family oxidoreductase [Phycisphaerales bacterium]